MLSDWKNWPTTPPRTNAKGTNTARIVVKVEPMTAAS